jgi:hypothetical protein
MNTDAGQVERSISEIRAARPHRPSRRPQSDSVQQESSGRRFGTWDSDAPGLLSTGLGPRPLGRQTFSVYDLRGVREV